MATVSLFLMPRSQKYDPTSLWFFITQVLWHTPCLTWHRFIYLQKNAQAESPRDLITCNPRMFFLNTLVFICPFLTEEQGVSIVNTWVDPKQENRTGRLGRNIRTGPASPHPIQPPDPWPSDTAHFNRPKSAMNKNNIHQTCSTHQASGNLCMCHIVALQLLGKIDIFFVEWWNEKVRFACTQ